MTGTHLLNLVVTSYLSNQTRKHKDTNEEVSHLKGNLKSGYRFWKSPNVDEAAHCKVVTTQVAVDKYSFRLIMNNNDSFITLEHI